MRPDEKPIMGRKTMMRFFGRSLLPLALVATCLNSHPAPASAATDAKPNILFVLIDDMGYGDLTCYGEHRVHTDQIDRIAAEGIRFTQFYVNAPICSPSRTALLTGQYPARWKITSYLDNRAMNTRRGMAQWLDPAAPSIARDIRAQGYATGHFGKWHMGGQRDVGDAPLITEYGFDKSLTTFEGLGDRILPILDAYDGTPPKHYSLGSDKLGRGNITWVERSKVTTSFVSAAITFIKQAEGAGKPFYVDVWPDDVHSPFFPPKVLRGDASKKQLYLGVVQATDDQLKPLFDFVRDDPALRDNTLIVIASDNGPEPGAGSAGTFRGQKGNLYEGGIREPFIVWGPGLLDKKSIGTVDDQTVIAGMDIRPSILSLLGHLPPANSFDGEDLNLSLLGKARQTRSRPICWLRPPDRPGPAKTPWPDLAIRDGNWKLLINTDGSSPQLYDLANDVNETTNLAAQNPARVDRLKKAVLAWRASMPLPEVAPVHAEANPVYMDWDDG
jgi:arylsulfatase A-like enzyme